MPSPRKPCEFKCLQVFKVQRFPGYCGFGRSGLANPDPELLDPKRQSKPFTGG